MITCTGFDYNGFYSLLRIFAPVFYNYSPYSDDDGRLRHRRVGRQRKINAEVCLGLVLVWTRTQGSLYALQPIFGLSYSCLTLWLRFGIRILQNILRKHPLARVKPPSAEEVRKMQLAVALRYPRLADVWGCCDGLNIRFETSGSQQIQRIYYNGWLHGHYISNVLVFAFDGTIRICGLNAPGSMHDSTVAEYSGVYDKLREVYRRTGGKVVVDSAFKLKNNPYIIRTARRVHFDWESILTAQEAVKLRQSAEWGMRAFQSSFPRLRDKIKFEDRGERLENLRLFVYLYNFRTNVVGCNQIRSTFTPWLEAEVDGDRTMFIVE